LDKTDLRGCAKPIMTASNIHYEIGERGRGISAGGIGAIHALARQIGLIAALDHEAGLLCAGSRKVGPKPLNLLPQNKPPTSDPSVRR
jgi:hypothetical protein